VKFPKIALSLPNADADTIEEKGSSGSLCLYTETELLKEGVMDDDGEYVVYEPVYTLSVNVSRKIVKTPIKGKK